MPLPPYYLEVILVSGVTCLAAVVMNGRGWLQVLFVSFTTVSAPIIDLSERPVESFLHLVQSPFRVFPLGESLAEVILFLLEQLRLAAHSGGPMG